MIEQNLTPADAGIANRIEALNTKFGIVVYPEQRQPLVEKYGLKA
jgi:hypothetical protein